MKSSLNLILTPQWGMWNLSFLSGLCNQLTDKLQVLMHKASSGGTADYFLSTRKIDLHPTTCKWYEEREKLWLVFSLAHSCLCVQLVMEKHRRGMEEEEKWGEEGGSLCLCRGRLSCSIPVSAGWYPTNFNNIHERTSTHTDMEPVSHADPTNYRENPNLWVPVVRGIWWLWSSFPDMIWVSLKKRVTANQYRVALSVRKHLCPDGNCIFHYHRMVWRVWRL